MHRREPPPQATWMLEHLTTGTRNEALAGDLLEELRAGRSNGWYWRQVLSAIALHWGQELWRRRIPLLFAALWCLLSPAWQLLWIRGFFQGNLIGHIWRLPWPWSTICAALVGVFELMLFLWIGAILYAVLNPFRLNWQRLRQLAKGLAWSAVVYAAACTCGFVILALTPPKPISQSIDWRTLTLLGVVENFSLGPLLMRASDLPAMACALWFLTPPIEHAPKSAGEPAI